MSDINNANTSGFLEVADKLYSLKASSLSFKLDLGVLATLALLPLLAFVSGRALFLNSGNAQDKLSHIPYAGGEGSKRKRLKEYKAQAKKLYSEGYRTFKSLYRVLSPEGDYVCVPYHLLGDYLAASPEVLNPHAPFEEFTEKAITDVNVTSAALIYSVKQDLTPSVGKSTPALNKVSRDAVLSETPACTDWTAVNVHHVLVRIVTLVSGWQFVGPDHCRTKDYMDLASSYATVAFGGPVLLQLFPRWSRRAVAHVLPPVRRVWSYHRRIAGLLGPAVRARREAVAAGRGVPGDMLQWMLENAHRFPDEITSDDDIARLQLSLSAVSIHTTVLTTTAILYDLAVEQEIVQDLRKEISQVLERYGGQVNAKSMFEMKLLDAVCKESQRLNPADLLSARRRSMKPFTFSDGTHVPAGTMLAVPVHHIGRDPSLFPEHPERFDPYRFTRLRQKDGEGNHFQFASVTNGTMAFGWGKAACPGRFFAAMEIKLILMHLVMHYDFKTPNGEGRYANVEFGNMNMPDTKRSLLLKRIG